MSDLKAVKAAERAAEREARNAERAARRSAAKADREAKPRKGEAPRELQVAITSFDFLDGRYRTARNSRLVSYVTLGVVAAVLMVILGAGLNNLLSANAERDGLTALQAQQQSLAAELGQSGGLSQLSVSDQIRARGTQATAALENEVDALRVLDDLRSAAPSGVVIDRIALPGGSTPAAPGTEPAAAAEEEKPKAGVITVSATASTYTQADDWDQQVASIGYLQNVVTDVTGSEGSITITTTATLGPEVTGARAAEIRKQFGLDSPAAGANSGGNK